MLSIELCKRCYQNAPPCPFASKDLVPNAPGPVMRNCFLPSILYLFHLVVKKEINKYSVDVCIGVVSFDFALYQLDAPYAAGYNSCQHMTDRNWLLHLQKNPYLEAAFPMNLHSPIAVCP